MNDIDWSGRVGVFQQIALGNHLTRMTNWIERLGEIGSRSTPGSYAGFEELPASMQTAAMKDMAKGAAALSLIPRHQVTAELFKNFQVAQRFGREARAQAIGELLDRLIAQDLALEWDDFLRSYA